MRVLALEPYYGGSHRAVLDGLIEHLADDDISFDVLSLPPRKWKWRMRGSAITMAFEARERAAEWRAVADDARMPVDEPTTTHPLQEACAGTRGPWDLIFASTFINLAEFVALAGDAVIHTPRIVYFHENQLLYPNRHTAEWDYQFALTNITSALTADHCLFNSAYNLEGFLAEIPGFLGEFPDHRPKGVAERIQSHSEVLQPPFDSRAFDAHPASRGVRPRIVWPHRWEHDKNPEAFFEAVARLADEGHDFEVAVAGQAFRETSEYMAGAASRLGDRLVHCGEPGDRDAYAALLASSDIAVSTAGNEFFGVAMIEACYAGCTPVVPDSLAYPELYERSYRYRSGDELLAQLRGLVTHRPAPYEARSLAAGFTFDEMAGRYASTFRRVAGVSL